MIIITQRKFFFAITGLLVALSLGSVAFFGLSFGTDFTGGTLAQIGYEGDRPEAASVEQSLKTAGFTGISLRATGENSFTLRAPMLSDEQRSKLASVFSVEGSVAEVEQLSEVGPVIGVELRNKAYVAIALVLVCILFFIAFAFRKVSDPVSSWMYGLIALVTLGFDVLIPVGFFAFLGSVTGAQVDTLFVTAVLTILGYSVHDTIVVFDRTRENLRLNSERNKKETFEETAGRSVQQTFTRSINTSLTTIAALLALYILGPDTTKDFSLTLLVGITAGTYSSIFFATPLLVAAQGWRKRSK